MSHPLGHQYVEDNTPIMTDYPSPANTSRSTSAGRARDPIQHSNSRHHHHQQQQHQQYQQTPPSPSYNKKSGYSGGGGGGGYNQGYGNSSNGSSSRRQPSQHHTQRQQNYYSDNIPNAYPPPHSPSSPYQTSFNQQQLQPNPAMARHHQLQSQNYVDMPLSPRSPMTPLPPYIDRPPPAMTAPAPPQYSARDMSYHPDADDHNYSDHRYQRQNPYASASSNSLTGSNTTREYEQYQLHQQVERQRELERRKQGQSDGDGGSCCECCADLRECAPCLCFCCCLGGAAL